MRVAQTVAGTIERELRVAASREIVFAYLTEPEKLVQWMGTTAELDPRPGGLFRLDYNGEHVARGEYIEVDPPNKVVLSWGWERDGAATPPGSSTVSFTLIAEGDETIVRMVHSGLYGDEIASHTMGWDMFLPQLAQLGRGPARAMGDGEPV